jgi:hypothetical protein
MAQARIKMTLPCGTRFEGQETDAMKAQAEHKKCSPGKCVVEKKQ